MNTDNDNDTDRVVELLNKGFPARAISESLKIPYARVLKMRKLAPANPYQGMIRALAGVGDWPRDEDEDSEPVSTCDIAWQLHGMPSDAHRAEVLDAIDRSTAALARLRDRLSGKVQVAA